MKKLTFLVSLLFLFSIMPLVCLAQLFWNTNGSSASWTASNWGTSGSGPFTNAWVSNSNTEFTANSSVTFATTSIGNIKVNNGVTATLTAAGTLGTNGNVRTIDVDGSGYLDFNNQAISTAGGTGFIKNGTGTWDIGSQPNAYTGGLTLNTGTIKVSGLKSLGSGALTINGGIIHSTGSHTFAVTSLTIGGDFTFSGTGADIWNMTNNIGSSTRTITNNITSGSRTFSGVITGSSGAGLTITGSGSGPIILTGTNTYAGLTTVLGGTLQLNKSGGGTLPSTNNATVNGGIFQFSSNQTLNDLTLNSGTIIVDNGVTLTINGNFSRNSGTTVTLTGTGTIQYSGNSILTYNGNAPQTITAAEFPSSGGPQSLIINNSSGVSFPSSCNRSISGNLALTSGTLADGGNTITVGGNITGTGSHTGSGKIQMTGSNQSISGVSIKNIELNNAGGFTLSGTPIISGTLTFTAGKITLGSNNLILASGAIISGATASNFIVTDGTGYLQRNDITTSTDFPVGPSVSSFNPVNIVNAGTADNFRIIATNDVLDSGTVGSALTANAVNKTWTITEETTGGSDVTLTVQWNASDELTSFDHSSCYLSHFSSGAWNSTTAGAASGSDPYTISRSGIVTFSPFSVGSGGALPVFFLYLKATLVNETAFISWATATELNNEYFSIERKTQKGNYEIIGKIKGAGNSSAILNYSFIDDKPVACSFNYYRISQHDYNGVSEVFGPVILKFNPINKISVWPNPFDTKLALNFNGGTIIEKLEVNNAKGEIVFQQTFLEKGLEIINTETWKSGTYFIAVSGPYFCKIFKFLKI